MESGFPGGLHHALRAGLGPAAARRFRAPVHFTTGFSGPPYHAPASPSRLRHLRLPGLAASPGVF